ncbi:hypothetical protein [Enterococcus casseliflavus]|uniref:hypothetical protein n=1 Tax=Enterococcus casseliflavus TaxID=37734 RepID=UPI00301631AB
MSKEKEVTITFEGSEILNLMDWFNGYTSKYYGSNAEAIQNNLPDNHKKLIDKLLKKYDEKFSVFLSEEELEMISQKQDEE